MFLVRAGTAIQVQSATSPDHFDWAGWRPYTTTEDRWYDKHEVWDAIAVANGRSIPEWARRNIVEFSRIVLVRNGKYALVKPKDIKFFN